MAHHYLLVQNDNLNASLFAELLQVFKTWIRQASTRPAYLYHKRTRDDEGAVIGEAYFEGLTLNKFKQALADAFDLASEDIEHEVSSVTYAVLPSTQWRFKRVIDSQWRFSVILFGSMGASWMESRIEVEAFLLANYENWQGVRP